MSAADDQFPVPLVESQPPQIVVGRYTYGQPVFLVYHPDVRIRIGSFCSIAGEVTIMGAADHHLDFVTTYPIRYAFNRPGIQLPLRKSNVVIGNDVWLGYGCTILGGVTIGDGAAIGARAVVTRDVEPYSIVAGNPARHIRYRFGKRERRKLLEMRWWDWPLDQIIERIDDLFSPDIPAFLKKYG